MSCLVKTAISVWYVLWHTCENIFQRGFTYVAEIVCVTEVMLLTYCCCCCYKQSAIDAAQREGSRKFLPARNARPRSSLGQDEVGPENVRSVGLESTGRRVFRGITDATCSVRNDESGRRTACCRRRVLAIYDGNLLRHFRVDRRSRDHCRLATFAEYLFTAI